MHVRPKRILWPTDFSELALEGGRYARAFREQFGAELHIIHVLSPPLPVDMAVMLPADVPVAAPDPDLLASCRKRLAEIVAEHFGGDPGIVCNCFYGNPWSGICEYAEKAAIDLIIVPTHGRTGLQRVLIGSTAEKIVQHARCPVLVVKSGAKGFLAD